MKRVLRVILFLVLMVGLIACSPDNNDNENNDQNESEEQENNQNNNEADNADDDEQAQTVGGITFPDKHLEAGILEVLEKSAGELTEADVEDVKELNLTRLGIEKLDGIEVFKSLEKVSLEYNHIEDFSPLENLENIKEIHVNGNPATTDQEQMAIIDNLTGPETTDIAEVNDDENNDDTPDNDTDQDSEDVIKTDATIESGKGGYLWRVENDGTTVYLQGTIHIGTEDFYPFHDSIEEAYESADIVVPEVDISEVDLLSSLGSTFMHGMYLDGSTIEDHISPDVYKKLDDTLDKYGLSVDLVGFFKPWMLDATLTQLIAEELDYMHGVDMYFLERANEDGKEIIELESVSDQYDVLAGQSAEFQEQQLEETLNSMENFEETMSQVFAVYLDGDEDTLLQMLFPEDAEMDDEYAEYMKALNDDRNVKMAEKITEFLEDGSGQTYFVIVGTAHLVKDPHIRTLLEEAGYDVEKIR